MELTIEKLVYGGDGLARLPADASGSGKAAFLPFVLTGERVEAELVESKPGFARARLERVLEPSARRVEPRCPYFQRCGGCHYQHADYEHQLEIKSAVLRENLRRLARLEWEGPIHVHPSPPWHYRNRTRMQVRAAPEFALGYFRAGSHELLPVEECPISSPLINRAIAALWILGREAKLPATSREVEFFADAKDQRLLVELHLDLGREPRTTGKPTGVWEKLWKELSAALPECAGMVLFAFQRNPGDVREPALLGHLGEPSLTYRTGGRDFRVSPGSFFQTNRHLTDELAALVSASGGETAPRGGMSLDLYAGVGLFAANLAGRFESVVAVESAAAAARDLRHNAPRNLRVVESTTEDFLANTRFDSPPGLAVLDPPRAGIGERVARALTALAAPRLTYVSCDPATLARDLRLLTEGGYHVEQVDLVDLFPQTFHIESVVRLAR